MKLHSIPARVSWRLMRRALALACAVALLSASLHVPAAAAQAIPEMIGQLSGDDVMVTGAASFDSENGRSTAILNSGSEVTVRTGQARIVLSGGGEIDVCGPAKFSLLKSGDAITIALDYGRVHPFLNGSAQLTVYTPLVVATPVAIGQDSRDSTVGLDQAGALCAFATRGAVRLEQQLSGQSLLVPQGGSVNMVDGQLSAQGEGASTCGCDLLVSRSISPKQFELSVPAVPSAAIHPAAIPPPPLAEPPVYMVYMPPLAFDASAPAPPPAPDPQTILLLREARVQPDVVFRGHVEDATPRPAASSAAPAQIAKRAQASPPPKGPGLFARFFGIFRRNKRAPCVGEGCSAKD